MGNIIGEGFKRYVIDQINTRQARLARQDRNTQTLLQENANSAWIKLTSSVLIQNFEKVKLPSTIEDAAKYFTLFGGTSIDLKPLGGLDSYKSFGFEQGYRPMPGITSLESKPRNRGSVRETTVKILAYSREQFYYIDLLYLRLGYSVLVEFGHSLYFDNQDTFQKFTDDRTLTFDFLGDQVSKFKGDHQTLLSTIEERRDSAAGNYDAVFGQIRNFDWTFTPEGYYDITLSIISFGDVLESLKANVQNSDDPSSPDTEESTENKPIDISKAKTDKEIIDTLKNLDSIGNLAWKIKNLFELPWNVIENSGNITTLKSIDGLGAVGVVEPEDCLRLYNQEKKSGYTYYITLKGFIRYLYKNSMLYVNEERTIPLLQFDLDPETNLIYRTPYTLSANPEVCVVKTNLTLDINGTSFGTSILQEGTRVLSFDAEDREDAGKILNVYVNLSFILKQINQLRDSDNNVNYFDLLQSICTNIQKALGGINTLEVIVEDTTARIIDQHAIPSLQKEVTDLGEFNIYGLRPGELGSFVTDFGIKTSITNALATTITVGAQANGTVKGTDATPFSKWNEGLIDRILPEKQNEDTKPGAEELKKLLRLEVKNRTLQEEYYRFVQDFKKYKWSQAKAVEFETILSNMLTFTEAASGIQGGGTKGGSLGFLPINLNFTFDGLSGIKIYQRFKINQNFLPYNYPETLQFIVTGITHRVENNRWTTSIDTNVVPETLVENAPQSFATTDPSPAVGTGTGTATTQNTNPVAFPDAQPGQVRLRVRRTSDDGIATIGKLEVLNPQNKVIKTYKTIERPWLQNQNRVSCIPPGTYNFVKSKANNNPKLGDVLRLTNPPFRNGILVHVGTKPTDSEGCILPTQLDGTNSRSAMKEILDFLYPQGSSSQSYTIEVYGVPNKEYVDIRNGAVYRGPGQGPTGEDVIRSRKLYIEYAGILSGVMQLQDNYDRGNPLLQETVGLFVNAVAEAGKRLKALFGDPNMTLEDGRLAPWNRLLELNNLIPAHKKLFRAELNTFVGRVTRRDGRTYPFKYPKEGDKEDFKTLNISYG